MSRYLDILTQSFERNFSDWESLSPLDPVKVLVESLAQSLTAIEARQTRLAETLVDSVPALFGFAAKPALLPRALVRLKTPPKKEYRFAFDGGRVLGVPVAEPRVYGGCEEKTKEHRNGWELVFKSGGKLSQLDIFFAPFDRLESGTPLRQVQVEIRRALSDERSVLGPGEFRTIDETDGFSRAGKLRVELLHESSVVQEGDSVRVLIDVMGKRPEGTLGFDLSVLELFCFDEETSLGFLKGDAWETVDLPADFAARPESFWVRFPDDRVVEIPLLGEDLLKLRLQDPARWAQGAIFDSARNRLVIPAADRWMKGFNGGVELWAREVRRIPSATMLDRLSASEAAENAVEWVSLLSAGSPRESLKDYAQRFHQELKLFSRSSVRVENVALADIAARAVGVDPSLRAVEHCLEADTNNVIFYALCAGPEDVRQSELEDAVHGRLAKYLSAAVPLGYRWEIRPFYATPLVIEADSSEASAATASLDFLTGYLGIPPYGSALSGGVLSRGELLKSVQVHVPVNRLAVRIGASGEYVDEWKRRPGEKFLVSVEGGGGHG